MQKQLSEYLVGAVGLQFFVAAFVDWCSRLAAEIYRGMGMKLPELTNICCLIGHWAFIWPVVATVLVQLVLRWRQSDLMRLHLVGGILSVSLAAVIVFIFLLLFPFTQILTLAPPD